MSAADSASSSSSAASSPPPPVSASPIASLYAVALDSALSFLSLGDLTSAVVVSSAWRLAVETRMPSLRIRLSYPKSFLTHAGVVPKSFLLGMYDSPLARHIAAIDPRYPQGPSTVFPLTSKMARLISQRLSGLEELHLNLYAGPGRPMVSPAELTMPPRLRRLEFGMILGQATVALRNSYLVLVGSLQRLESLKLWRSSDENLCYAPLRGCAALREIDLGFFADPANDELCNKQIADLRSLRSVEWMRWELMPQRIVRKLLAPPHALQWTTLQLDHACSIDDSIATQLRSLPTLTRLDGHFEGRSLSWLSALPRLQFLSLSVSHAQADAVEFVASMHACTQMRELRLIGFPALGESQLASALARMHGLASLSLDRMPQIRSLSFLRSLPLLASSLTVLRVCFVQGVAADSLDFDALFALTSLRSVDVARCGGPLPTILGARFERPPAGTLPHLTSFILDGHAV